jgi:tetratricopeptide (TPR) repeat protein
MRLSLCLLIVFTFSNFAVAQDTPFQSNYKTLFNNPSSSTVKYRQLRDAYTQDPAYDPTFERYEDNLRLIGENYSKGNYAESIKYAERVISADPCNTSAHSMLGASYKAIGNKRLFELHNKFYNGLAKSIIDSGEFGNPKKPFHLVTRYELYAIIDYLGFKLETAVPIVDENGSGVWAHVTNRKNEKGVLYFEVNKIESWNRQKK